VEFRDLITWCNISYQLICNERDTWKFGVTTNVKGPLISEVSRRNCNFYVFYLFFVCRCHLTWKSKNNSSSLIIRSYDTGTIQNTRSYSRKQSLWNACVFLGMSYEKKKQNENSLENVTCIGKNKTYSWRDLLRKNFWKDVRKSIASCCVLLIMVYSLHFLVGGLTLRPIWSLQTRTLQLRLANCKLWAMQLQNTCSEQRTKFDPRGSSTSRKIPTQSSIGQLGLMLAGITCLIAFIFFPDHWKWSPWDSHGVFKWWGPRNVNGPRMRWASLRNCWGAQSYQAK